MGREGLEEDSVRCFENAVWLYELFKSNNISAMLNEYVVAAVVVFIFTPNQLLDNSRL